MCIKGQIGRWRKNRIGGAEGGKKYHTVALICPFSVCCLVFLRPAGHSSLHVTSKSSQKRAVNESHSWKKKPLGLNTFCQLIL